MYESLPLRRESGAIAFGIPLWQGVQAGTDSGMTIRGFDALASERMTGIEPAYSAWEADVLPLNYIRSVPHVSGDQLCRHPQETTLQTAAK